MCFWFRPIFKKKLASMKFFVYKIIQVGSRQSFCFGIFQMENTLVDLATFKIDPCGLLLEKKV
jgi:hypothetical protein